MELLTTILPQGDYRDEAHAVAVLLQDGRGEPRHSGVSGDELAPSLLPLFDCEKVDGLDESRTDFKEYRVTRVVAD